MILIGIDCGKHTGIAVYDTNLKEFLEVKTYLIHNALNRVEEIYKKYKKKVLVYIENPNTFVPFGVVDTGRLQGAGSIKRDFRIWKDFLEEKNIPYKSTRLQGSMKKMKAQDFKELTGWTERTNEHNRDAALLIYNKEE